MQIHAYSHPEAHFYQKQDYLEQLPTRNYTDALQQQTYCGMLLTARKKIPTLNMKEFLKNYFEGKEADFTFKKHLL